MLDNRKDYMVYGWKNLDQDDSKIYLNDNDEAQEVCRMISKLTGKIIHIRERISKDKYQWCYSYKVDKNKKIHWGQDKTIDKFNEWAEKNGFKYDYETKRYFEKNLTEKELEYVYDNNLSFVNIDHWIILKQLIKTISFDDAMKILKDE